MLYPPIQRRKITMPSVAERIYEIVKPLPESLHFVEYLNSKTSERAEMTALTRAQETAMQHVWDNPDDEVWNDIKTL